jgi:serine/threonine protein kinase
MMSVFILASSWWIGSSILILKIMNNYHIYEEIGKGKYSVVYKGRKKKSIEYVAVKSLEKSRRKKLMNEVRDLNSLFSVGQDVLGLEPPEHTAVHELVRDPQPHMGHNRVLPWRRPDGANRGRFNWAQ